MKKLFLLAAIFCFLFSNAQQDIYFYPQRPVKKFQSYQPWNNQPKIDLRKEWSKRLEDFVKTSPGPKAKLLTILKDSTRIFSLPQDNMICLVPDMNQFNMPNAAISKFPFEIPSELRNQLQKQPGRIPNPAIPFIIPQRKDTPTQ